VRYFIKVLLFFIISNGAFACYEDTIMSPTPFMGNDGEIFKLSNGTIWEVNYEYEYMYEYYPSVTVCPDQGFIIVSGTKLNVSQISGNQSSSSSNVIESRIDGESEGFEGDTIFKLINGQIWQQVDGRYKYKYKYSPKVLIYKDGSSYKMSIEGIDKKIRVIRLK